MGLRNYELQELDLASYKLKSPNSFQERRRVKVLKDLLYVLLFRNLQKWYDYL
jgi:DNA polymerase III psi subunit